MCRIKNLLAVLIIVFLAGCASPEKFVAPTSLPTANMGYVGGRFTLDKKVLATAFVLTNQSTQQEFVLPFTSKTDYLEGNTETGLIALPPGTYKATHWIVYNTFWGPSAAGREFKRPIQESNFTQPFLLKSGEIVFLGRFIASSTWQYGYIQSTTYGRWVAEKLSAKEAEDFLQASYPAFSNLQVTCIACSR